MRKKEREKNKNRKKGERMRRSGEEKRNWKEDGKLGRRICINKSMEINGVDYLYRFKNQKLRNT